MNQVLVIGVDEYVFYRLNKIGYWHNLTNNFFNCDIIKPFRLQLRDTQALIQFDIITMWEVLEHIAEGDLYSLLGNITCHLNGKGYFAR